jgi:Ser-tRNA(Ala) deacylase AlaX
VRSGDGFPRIVTGARIADARLRLFRFHTGTSVIAARVDYAPTLEATDVPMTAQGSAGTFDLEDAAYGFENTWVATNATGVVQAMVNESKTLFQFRFVAPLSATDA